MDILVRHLPFVKEQVNIQERLARKFDDQPWRKDLHEKSAALMEGRLISTTVLHH